MHIRLRPRFREEGRRWALRRILRLRRTQPLRFWPQDTSPESRSFLWGRKQMRSLLSRSQCSRQVRNCIRLCCVGGGVKTFPLTSGAGRALLKKLHLGKESNSPLAAMVAVQIKVDPVEPRILQSGLFLPAAPEPEKLHPLLARLRALAGENRVG